MDEDEKTLHRPDPSTMMLMSRCIIIEASIQAVWAVSSHPSLAVFRIPERGNLPFPTFVGQLYWYLAGTILLTRILSGSTQEVIGQTTTSGHSAMTRSTLDAFRCIEFDQQGHTSAELSVHLLKA